MKKHIYTFLLLVSLTLSSVSVYSQEFAGLSYGTPYEQACKFLKKKFGKPCFIEGKSIVGFQNAQEGNISFMFANFHFEEKEGETVFKRATFLSNYKNYEEAFTLYSSIQKSLKEKYKNDRIEFKADGMGDDFSMQCNFGTHPIHSDQYYGKLTLHRGKNKEGKKFYYVKMVFPNEG